MDRSNAIAALRERLADLAGSRGSGEGRGRAPLPTFARPLAAGAVHEWLAEGSGRGWTPPLAVLVDLARRAGEYAPGTLVWIGTRAWPHARLGLSLRRHPVVFIRERLDRMGVVPASALADPALTPSGASVSIAGLVLVRQRPGTASGIVFITLEDETGIANLIVRPKVYERFRRAARHSPTLLATGTVERQGIVVHLLVTRLAAVKNPLAPVVNRSRDFH